MLTFLHPPPAQVYSNAKDALVRLELQLMREFGFVMHVEHPHKFALSAAMQLFDFKPDVLQQLWNLLNDSGRTTLCVRFRAEVVACGLIFMAARKCKVGYWLRLWVYWHAAVACSYRVKGTKRDCEFIDTVGQMMAYWAKPDST